MKALVTWLLRPVLGVLALLVFLTVVGEHAVFLGVLFGAAAKLQKWAAVGPVQHLLAVAVACGIAFFLYGLRQTQPSFYGAVEMVIGVLTLWLVLGSSTPPAVVFVAMAGAIYVIVRGLDNFRKGYPAVKDRVGRVLSVVMDPLKSDPPDERKE